MLQDPQKKLHQLENKLNEWISTGMQAPYTLLWQRGAHPYLHREKEETNICLA